MFVRYRYKAKKYVIVRNGERDVRSTWEAGEKRRWERGGQQGECPLKKGFCITYIS
jgi:hypothetical protein